MELAIQEQANTLQQIKQLLQDYQTRTGLIKRNFDTDTTELVLQERAVKRKVDTFSLVDFHLVLILFHLILAPEKQETHALQQGQQQVQLQVPVPETHPL